MLAIGYMLSSSTSPGRKHYTVIAFENGLVLTHSGQRNRATNALTPGTYRTDKYRKASLASAVASVFNSKVKKNEYNELSYGFVKVDIPDVPQSADLNWWTEAKMKAAMDRFRSEASRLAGTKTTVPNSYSTYGDPVTKFLAGGSTAPVAPQAPVASKQHVAAASQKFTKTGGKSIRPNGEEYFPREIFGHTDVALLHEFRTKGVFVRLAGPPGGGKTALVEGSFKDLVTVNGHGDMTVANFVGNYLPDPANPGGWIWSDGPLVRAMKNGHVLFVDEGTRIPTEVLNILFSVMDGRGVLRIDDRPDLPMVTAIPGFYVVMGYNPDTLGARALDEALVSRFRVQIEVTTDFTTAKRLKVPDLAIKIARNLETRNQRDIAAGGPGVWVPQMRELITFRDLINMNVGEDFALSTLVASCPRQLDLPNLVEAIETVAKKKVSQPALGGIV